MDKDYGRSGAALLRREGWDVRPCHAESTGHLTCYDVCHTSEPGATGVAVIASVYEGESIARSFAALPELLAAVDALLDGPISLNAGLKQLRAIRAKIGLIESLARPTSSKEELK